MNSFKTVLLCFLSQPFKTFLRYWECALLPPKTLVLSGELEICVFFISYYLVLFYKRLTKFNIY